MELNNLEQRLAALPEKARQEVAELIAALEARHKRLQGTTATQLSEEPFIGCWNDREDLADSSAWVRRTRQREWRTLDA